MKLHEDVTLITNVIFNNNIPILITTLSEPRCPTISCAYRRSETQMECFWPSIMQPLLSVYSIKRKMTKEYN